MEVSVTLKITGGKLKDQVVVVKPEANFFWETPKEVDKDWFDLLLQEAAYDAGHVAFPNIRWMDIELNESIKEDSDEALDTVSMVQLLNALWWDAKEKGVKVEKLSSIGVSFEFKEPDFSGDEYIR